MSQDTLTPQQHRYITQATPEQCQWLWATIPYNYFTRNYLHRALYEKIIAAKLSLLPTNEARRLSKAYPRTPKPANSNPTQDPIIEAIASLL